MSVKKSMQKESISVGLTSKQKTERPILKISSSQLQLQSDYNSFNKSDSVNKTSDHYKTDTAKHEELSFDDNDEESATDDESIIDCGDATSEQEDDEGQPEINSSSKEVENIVLKYANNSNSVDSGVPNKQQQSLAHVMSCLLKKKKSVVELMNTTKSTGKETERHLAENDSKKRKQEQTGNVLELVAEDGSIEKVNTVANSSKKLKTSTEETEPNMGKRHFPTNSRTDPYYQDPYLDTDVVKEKKLRSLATQGVVQLFNTLEQFRQQDKEMAAAKGGRSARLAPHQPEVSAITSGGKAGLIDFLMKKGKGGGGLPSRTSDRPLFSEVKREEGPLESR